MFAGMPIPIKSATWSKVSRVVYFGFWAVNELDMSIRQLVKGLEMSPPGVGISLKRGQAIAHEYVALLPIFLGSGGLQQGQKKVAGIFSRALYHLCQASKSYRANSSGGEKIERDLSRFA